MGNAVSSFCYKSVARREIVTVVIDEEVLMIDRELRTKLSGDLRALVTGRMTNDDFDDVYYGKYLDSDDQAVREIAEFGWTMYSSDLLYPYRLRGRHAVGPDERKFAARSILFLRTNNEYQEPPESERFTSYRSTQNQMFLFMWMGILLCPGWLIAFSLLDPLVSISLLFAGFVLILVSRIVAYFHRYHFIASSPVSIVWPFIDVASLQEAKANFHMLGKSIGS